jgi:2-polyprenyl-6-methoxyphenol hydroxylase-like FAD-dependent oxidoreductase
MTTAYDLVIVGGGPAGMVSGLLFARAGLRTLVLEKHKDFLRDFRGDTVHPSTLQVFHELGLLDELLQRPHNKVTQLGARIGGQFVHVADFGSLPVAAPYLAIMPQWEFLDFVASAARRYPGFELRQSCAAVRLESLLEADGRVTGVQTSDGDTVRARLVIACDGRDSRFRAGLPQRVIGAPMDVFWFRLPKHKHADNDSMGVFDNGRIMVLIDRGDYWQCAFVFAKGAADALRAEGLDAFRARVKAVAPELEGTEQAIRSWDDVKLLSVTVDRLDRWWRPGLLLIGDAAHAMSPIGGVGINLAVQDAVASANLVSRALVSGAVLEPCLEKLQARRMRPAALTQALQKLAQDAIIAPLLSGQGGHVAPPLPVRLLEALPLLRGLPGRLIGMGLRPEHVHSPDAYLS